MPIDAEEGVLEIADGIVRLTVHEGLGLLDQEVELSKVDSVSVTKSPIRDVSRISVSVKGSERLAATVPDSKVKAALKSLTLVEEDAKPKTAAARETRTTKPEETRA